MAQTSILENTVGEKISHDDPVSRSILFYSRQIVLKNIPAFRRAFDVVQKESPDISLETGSITHENLLLRMRTCYAVAIPSVSEVAPNTLIDALRCGKPCILSKYSGYAERFKDMCILVDPLSEVDMARGIREIYDTQVYDRLVKNIRSFRDVRTYTEVAHDLVLILEKI